MEKKSTKSGYRPSDSVKKRIAAWEGSAMTGAIDPLSGKWGKNRTFEEEASSFYHALPADIREQVISNPGLADNLFSYSYNVGAGRFKERVVPALRKYYAGKGSAEEIASSMWASGDKKLRGLRNRRAVERQGVVDSLAPSPIQPVFDVPADNTFVFNPFPIHAESTTVAPIMVPDTYVEAHRLTPSEDKVNRFQEAMEARRQYNNLMDVISIQNNPTPQYTPQTNPANAPYVVASYDKGGYLRKSWNDLSMSEKAEMMKVAVRNGITNLQDIRDKYNEFAEGGDTDWSYNSWKRQIAKHMGIRPDEDNTYDYEAFFKKYPKEAWKMLSGDPTAHFSDEFKTVYHPTFSSKSIGNDGSIYSGVRNPKTNPQGLIGGTWSPDYHTFTMSPDGYRGPVSMDDRKWYLENAEDNGVVLREADGSLPVYDGIPWGGVLPNIIINGSRRGRKFEDGGFTSELDWSPDSWFSKRVAKPDGTLYNDEEAARLASHVPEYNNIEQTAKANGTWLKMSDGSTWEGDPRSWVMMQSEAYKKNYSPRPWYTGQAEWPTTFDYGEGKVDTNKVTRAPYYNNQMWFSDSKDYGQTFADYQNSTGLGWRFDTPGEEDIKGHNFLSAIPKEGNYRTLESPANGRPDQWQRLPFVLEDGTINRLPESQISVDSKGRNIRADKQKVLTDDVVNWSKDLGDQGIFMQNIDDGAIIKNGEIHRQPVNEFISQPGFTNKVKFIEGNTGDFDIDNPYKYANNFYVKDNSLDNNYAALGGPLVEAAMNEYANGGGIHIASSKKGTFTAAAKKHGKSVQAFASQVLAHPENYSPAMRKKANFARNASHWKHGLGGNLFDGTSQPTQKMQIGLDVQGWPDYTTQQIIAYGEENERRRKAMQDAYLNFVTESNDATAVANGRPQNQHLEERGIKGAKAHAAWEKEHPNLTAWGNVLGAVPFAVAAYPLAATAGSGIVALGDAAATTSVGQGITNFLAPIATTSYAGATVPQWLDLGLTSSFGAHGLQTAIDEGGISPTTALELLPVTRVAKPAVEMGYNAAKPAIDRTVTTLQNNYPALFDPYTSWDATLGYHGDNIFSRAIGTVGRRYGYTPKAEVPEFHRRLTINRPSQLKLDEEGNMIISSGRTGEGHDGIVNFATSEPARGHSSHKSLSGIDDYIIDSKAIGNQDFKSIQPSDTFFETGQLAIDPKSMTLVSGNTEMLDYARSLGMRTLSSPRLRQLTASRMTKEDVINSRSEGIAKFLQNVGEIKYGKGQENAGQIGEEMQRLTSMRGTPTMQDYGYFEGLTGLNSGVRPAEMWNGTKEQGLELFGNWGKPRRTPTFNHVAYAPASNIEAIYREAKMGTRPWEDYYAALENMPSARQQLGLNSAMDTYLGEPIVPENFLTTKPQVRTKVGDVEIDNPNLLYHLDRGNGAGAFSTQGAYVEDGILFPGVAKKEGQLGYSWWNKGKPYATAVHGQPMTRLMTTTEDTPGMLHVKSQNYPIGQWTGSKGFVLPSEYVNSEGVNVLGKTYTLDPNYGWRKVYAEETPTAEWPMGRTVPQITAENAASPHVGIDYSDFSSTVNPTSIFEKLTYQNRINGFPNLSFSGRDDAGNIIFSPDVIKGLSSEAKDNLMYNTVGRNIREFKQAGYDDIMNNIYKEKAEQLFDDVNVGRYSGKDYAKAGEEDSGGFFNQDRNFISINKDSGFPETFVEGHEGRHLLDYNSSLLDSQYKILGDAYDSDFINIPNTEYAGYLKGYKFMDKEKVTTNRDARDVLFDKFGKHLKYADYNLQDKFIDKLSDDAIFEAVEKANGYGKRFIQFLRDNGKLTPEKAQQFREAMKHVGAVAAPVGLTGYGLFNSQEALGGRIKKRKR